jgi:hypothetical protein
VPTYHRIESPTQSFATALRQRDSGEIWGRVPRAGFTPVVQAYVGDLPVSRDGIEFTTDIPPELLCPPGQAEWRPPRISQMTYQGIEYAVLSPVQVTRIVHNGQEQ